MITTTAVKSRPILFSRPMIRAILAGRKTQTRRIIKGQPFEMVTDTGIEPWKGRPETLAASIKCPYGAVGDLLWCRETFAKPEPGVMSRDHDGSPIYAADYPPFAPTGFGPWKPSIFMPRWASRITLEVADVRVERLNDITEEDAKAEGVDSIHFQTLNPWVGYPVYREPFGQLWEKINGKGSWALNPWVFVVSFRRIEQPK